VIEAELARLQRSWPDAINLRCPKYSHFCWLPVRFAPAFPHVTEQELLSLSVFCILFVAAVEQQDHLLDDTCPLTEVGLTSMRIMALEAEATQILHRLFPPSAHFWDRHRAYLADHARAFVVEQDFRRGRRGLAEYTEEVALHAAADKIGLARIAIAALAELNGDDRLVEPICASLAHVGEATGMYDDLTDWKEDLRRGQPSLLLSRAVVEFPGLFDEPAWAELIKHLTRAIHYGGHSRYVLRLALSSLDKADRLEELLPGLPWYEHTRALRRVCQETLDVLTLSVCEDVARVRRGSGPSTSSRATLASPLDQRALVRPWQLVVDKEALV
jgi:hypothetical protein